MSSNLTDVYLQSANKTVTLGNVIGEGEQATVFELGGECVAKIYSVDESATTTPKKASLMVKESVPQLADATLAWPLDLALDQKDGEIVGVVMTRIPAFARPFAAFANPAKRPLYAQPYAFRLALMLNLARFVAAAHKTGTIVLGDGLSPQNILFDRDKAIFLIDVDSWQLRLGGETYHCGLANSVFGAPELYSADLRCFELRHPQDNWSLAVAIFQLGAGCHPFDRVKLHPTAPDRETLLLDGKWPLAPDADQWGVAPRPSVSPELFPPDVWTLLRETFEQPGCTLDPSARPAAQQWVDALDAAAADQAFLKTISAVENRLFNSYVNSATSSTAAQSSASPVQFATFLQRTCHWLRSPQHALIASALGVILLFGFCFTAYFALQGRANAPDAFLSTGKERRSDSATATTDSTPRHPLRVPVFFRDIRNKYERSP